MNSRRIQLWLLVTFWLALAGCSDSGKGSDARQPVFKTHGKITMSGGPVANAIVSFSPKNKQPVAMGRTGADGTYSLTTYDAGDGAAEGDYVVLVTKPGSTSAAPTSGGHDPKARPDERGTAMHAAQGAAAGADTSSVLPEKYSRADQSTLFAKVEKKSENVLDFDLKP